MTLADELMNRRPLVPLSPGRIVSHADPYEDETSVISRDEILEWANGSFTSHDVAQVFGIDVKTAAAHLGRMDGTYLERVGKDTNTGGRPLVIWRKRDQEKVKQANRKHFGA